MAERANSTDLDRRRWLKTSGATLLAGAAGVAVYDPIFAAIAAHRAAWLRLEGKAWRADTIDAERRGINLTDADTEIHRDADAREERASRAFIATPPTTAQGVRAMITHYLRHADEFESAELTRDMLATLIKSPALAG